MITLLSANKNLFFFSISHDGFLSTVEPILNPAEELQAVGRVHRIGQTKATVVHR